MKLRNVLVSTGVLMSMLTGPTAMAGGGQGGGGQGGGNLRFEDVTLKDLGTRLKATGTVEGLKKFKDLELTLIAVGDMTVKCIKKDYKHHQTKTVVVEDRVFKTLKTIDVGMEREVDFRITAGVREGRVIPGAPDCGQGDWKEIVKDVAFTKATLIARQHNKKAKLVCTFDPTTDGEVVQCEGQGQGQGPWQGQGQGQGY